MGPHLQIRMLYRENDMLRVQVERMRTQSLNAVRRAVRQQGWFRVARNAENNNLGGNVRSSKRDLEHLRNRCGSYLRQTEFGPTTSRGQHAASRCIQNQKDLFNQEG